MVGNRRLRHGGDALARRHVFISPESIVYRTTSGNRLVFARCVLGMVFVAWCSDLRAQGSSLDYLIRPHAGRSRRISSAAESPLSNADNRWIKGGDTFVLADI